MSSVYDLFPPLLASIAQAGTGHHRVANTKEQRCIPFGVSDNNFNVTYSTKQKGIFLGFVFLLLYGASELLVKKSLCTVFHLV